VRSLLIFLTLLGSVGCQPACHSEARVPVPPSAEVVLYTNILKDLTTLSGDLALRMDSTWELPRLREIWFRNIGLDLIKPETWETLGIDTGARSTLFRDDGYWVLRGTKHAEKDFAAWIKAREDAGTVDVQRDVIDGFQLLRVRVPGPESEGLFARATRGSQVLLIPGERLLPGSKPLSELHHSLAAWAKVEDGTSWRDLPWTRDFQNPTEADRMVGGIQPKSFLPETKGEEHAAAIWSRMRHQFGPVGLKIQHEEDSVRILARLNTDLSEPSFVPDIQGALGLNPEIGGLIVPGVLGVGRLSVNPRKTFDLVRSLLPADKRLELDRLVEALDEQLAIDVKVDVLDNFVGHAIMIVYGFEPRMLNVSGAELFGNLFFLRATREALYLPIRNSERMEDILNAWTQISDGKLNRQRVENHLQYAWIEDSSLSWALLLGSDHLILVDSTAAFDRAMAFQRASRPTGITDPNIAPLLERRDRSGFFIDTRALANLLQSSKELEWIVTYLRPWHSIRLISDAVESGRSDLIITLIMDEPEN